MYQSERQIAAQRKRVAQIARRPPKRLKEQQRPSSCLILKGDNLFEVDFQKSGKPTAASERMLESMGCMPTPKSDEPVADVRALVAMMKGV